MLIGLLSLYDSGGNCPAFLMKQLHIARPTCFLIKSFSAVGEPAQPLSIKNVFSVVLNGYVTPSVTASAGVYLTSNDTHWSFTP